LLFFVAAMSNIIFSDSKSVLHGFEYFIVGVVSRSVKDYVISTLSLLKNKSYLFFISFLFTASVVLFGRDMQYMSPFLIASVLPVFAATKHEIDDLFGDLSYSIYLLHLPVMLIISKILGRQPLEPYSNFAVFAGIVSTIIVGSISCLFVYRLKIVQVLRSPSYLPLWLILKR